MTSEPGAAPLRPAASETGPRTGPHTLDLGRISVGAGPVDAYLRAVGDELPIYRQTGLAPPLYAAAAALGLLLKRLALPPGAIHSLQETEVLAPIAIGGDLAAAAVLERPRQRGGLRFITASCALSDDAGAPALAGKTTVMLVDDAAAPPGDPGEAGGRGGPGDAGGGSDLPTVARVITPEGLRAYAAAAGDDNPLHLDAAFAAATRFGGIIAHGMLTLAWLSEMMAAALGQRWLTGGALRARFKGAAYLGDRVETWGRRVSPDPSGGGDGYAVGVRNSVTGEDLITGAAAVKDH